ncbi:Protein of unknown function, partial [Gryllus bimaculatus]
SSVQDHQEEARLRRRRRRRHSAQCYQPSDCKNSLFEESVEREDGSGKEEVRVQTWENSEGVLKGAWQRLDLFDLLLDMSGEQFQPICVSNWNKIPSMAAENTWQFREGRQSSGAKRPTCRRGEEVFIAS